MKSILIAEPHGPTLDLVRQLLAEAGYRVLTAREPGDALEQASSEHPDAVLIAVDLARHEGMSLGKLLRATEAGARLPLLAIDKGHLGKAKGVSAILDLMVNGYVPDPTKKQDLLGRIEQLLSAASNAPRPTSGIAATLHRTPVLTGELKTRQLPAHLLSWFRLARDGVLVAAQAGLTRRVFFSRGRPVNYDSSAQQDSLSRFLLEQSAIDARQHAEMLAAMTDGALSEGAALVAVGAVEPGEPLLARLKEYARAKIAEVYGMSSGRFSFYAGDEFRTEVPSLELPALSPLYDAVRTSWPVKALAQQLAPQMKAYPSRTPEFARDLADLGLTTADLKLALGITGRQTLRELLVQGRTDLKHGYALLWYLATVGAVSFSATPTDSAMAAFEAAEQAARTGRKRLKPLPEEKSRELSDHAVRILTASYFRALGLDITADGEAVERAYHEVATRFHPESYPDNDLSELEDLLASVQERLSAAYRVLSDEKKRENYVNYLLSRSDVVRGSAPVVAAEIELKRGEKHMLKGDWTSAMKAFEQATSLNPREAEYYSYLAWATFKAGAGDRPVRARAAQKLLKKALALNPTLVRPQVISAIIEHETGDGAEARRILLRVLKTNPESQFAKKALQGLNRRVPSGR